MKIRVRKSAIACGVVLGTFAMAPGYAVAIPFVNSSTVTVDGGDDTITIPVAIGDIPSGALDLVTDVNVSITFTHDVASEIIFRLAKDAGPPVTLVGATVLYASSSTGSSGVTVTFDDQITFPPKCTDATPAIDCTVDGTSPATGTFRPEDLLAALSGGTASGDWILTLEDTGGGDPLTVTSFNLDITLQDAPPTGAPEPATALLLGLGLAGLAGSRRRRN